MRPVPKTTNARGKDGAVVINNNKNSNKNNNKSGGTRSQVSSSSTKTGRPSRPRDRTVPIAQAAEMRRAAADGDSPEETLLRSPQRKKSRSGVRPTSAADVASESENLSETADASVLDKSPAGNPGEESVGSVSDALSVDSSSSSSSSGHSDSSDSSSDAGSEDSSEGSDSDTSSSSGSDSSGTRSKSKKQKQKRKHEKTKSISKKDKKSGETSKKKEKRREGFEKRKKDGSKSSKSNKSPRFAPIEIQEFLGVAKEELETARVACYDKNGILRRQIVMLDVMEKVAEKMPRLFGNRFPKRTSEQYLAKFNNEKTNYKQYKDQMWATGKGGRDEKFWTIHEELWGGSDAVTPETTFQSATGLSVRNEEEAGGPPDETAAEPVVAARSAEASSQPSSAKKDVPSAKKEIPLSHHNQKKVNAVSRVLQEHFDKRKNETDTANVEKFKLAQLQLEIQKEREENQKRQFEAQIELQRFQVQSQMEMQRRQDEAQRRQQDMQIQMMQAMMAMFCRQNGEGMPYMSTLFQPAPVQTFISAPQAQSQPTYIPGAPGVAPAVVPGSVPPVMGSAAPPESAHVRTDVRGSMPHEQSSSAPSSTLYAPPNRDQIQEHDQASLKTVEFHDSSPGISRVENLMDDVAGEQLNDGQE